MPFEPPLMPPGASLPSVDLAATSVLAGMAGLLATSGLASGLVSDFTTALVSALVSTLLAVSGRYFAVSGSSLVTVGVLAVLSSLFGLFVKGDFGCSLDAVFTLS